MERDRIEVVKEFLKLPIDKDEELQELAYLAAEICHTPIASITFVDDKMQYPIVGKGNVIESTCDVAFCNHTIKQDRVLEITDALDDPRFSNNPLVTEDPFIRFYAGAPLKTTTGDTVGSLCVIDQQPKKLTESQVKSLEILSRQVVHRLELQLNTQRITDSIIEVEQNMQLLAQAQIMKNSFFDRSDDYFLLLNNKFEIVSFNAAAEKLLSKRDNGFPLQEGKVIFEYLPTINIPFITDVLTRAGEGQTIEFEILANQDTANSFWNKFTVSPASNNNNEFIGIACLGCNIEKEKKQEEKIRVQNYALAQIAKIHSHEIRHPLTNILGVIDLIKQEDFVMNKEYLQYLETASKELDDMIRKVVLDSHKAA